jgi:hypothetical protein
MRLSRITAAIAAALLALAFFGAAAPASAVTGAVQTAPAGDIQIETPIPQSALEKGVSAAETNTVKGAADYLGRVYTFAISIVGLVATVMFIIGGFQYLTSAGDASKIGAAKKRITDALIGLVLALGSYALLNTLNPQLVTFKPLTVQNAEVKKNLQTLPWCEDLIDKGVAVKNIADTKRCGEVGSYMSDKTELPCIYRGSCAATLEPTDEYGSHFSNTWHTCLQEVNPSGGSINTQNILDYAKSHVKDETVLYGHCTTCAQINQKTATDYGYPSLEAACSAWDVTINGYFKQKYGEGSQFWAYCEEAGDNIDGEDDPHSCIQLDIDCQKADNNEDTGSGQCSDDENDCGCEGYDDGPNPWYAVQLNADGYVSQIGHADDTVDGVSAYHLGQLCNRNPCMAYTNTVNNQKNFSGGCVFKGELTRHVTTDLHIDCRNR